MCDDFIVTKWESSSEHQRAAIATSYQDALMFATYCLVPIRESNMLGLELQVSLLRNDAGGYDICIGMMDFKSRFIFKIQFPSVLQEYLEDFIERWRPILNKRNDNYLFHTRTGGLLRYKAANDRMIAIGKNLCGIHTNPHHFRMLCASAYLSDHPEEFEQVRQLLGHKYIRTTVEQYTHLFSLNASRKAAVFARETAPDFSNLCSGLPLNERVQDAVRRYSPKATGSGN